MTAEVLLDRREAASHVGVSEIEFSGMVRANLLHAPVPKKSPQRWLIEHLDKSIRSLDPLLFDRNVYDTEVYFIGCNEFCKIGFSGSAEWRMRTLQAATPYELKLLHKFRGDNRVEEKLHRLLANSRVRGEWFYKSAALMGYLTWLKVRHP